MYLTHFGRVGGTGTLARDLVARIRAAVAIGERYRDSPSRPADIEQALLDQLTADCREHGVALADERLRSLLQPDAALNAAGIDHWLTRRHRS